MRRNRPGSSHCRQAIPDDHPLSGVYAGYGQSQRRIGCALIRRMDLIEHDNHKKRQPPATQAAAEPIQGEELILAWRPPR